MCGKNLLKCSRNARINAKPVPGALVLMKKSGCNWLRIVFMTDVASSVVKKDSMV
jgi:hypothetical protein